MRDLYRVRLPATVAAVRRARHGVVDAFAQAGVSDAALLADVALAVSEATTNVVRHAYPPDGDVGHFDVIVTRTPGSLIVTVKDEGVGMRAHPLSHGLGVGLQVMNAQTEHLEIESNSTGTTVALHFTDPTGR